MKEQGEKSMSGKPKKKPAPKNREARERAARLLDAHVKYELRRFTKAGVTKTVREEVGAAYDWMQEVKLKAIFTPEHICEVIRRLVVEMPVAGGITEIAGEMSRKVVASEHNEDALFQDIFPRKIFDAFGDKIASLESVRTAVIRRTVRNSAYARLVSEAIYTISKGFVLRNNPVVRKAPIISSLISMGKEALNMAAPGLEPTIDDQIKYTIERHIEAVIQESEEFLLEFLDEERFAGISSEAWKHLADNPLSKHLGNLNSDDMEDFVVLVYEFWLNFRETDYFRNIYTELVDYFFEKYGDTELDVLLEDMGVTQDLVTMEITQSLIPIAKAAVSTGLLEQRLRARFKSFYFSKAALAII